MSPTVLATDWDLLPRWQRVLRMLQHGPRQPGGWVCGSVLERPGVGTHRFSARIYDLTQKGHPVESKPCTCKPRCPFYKFRLIEGDARAAA